jgi:hypothetical protein
LVLYHQGFLLALDLSTGFFHLLRKVLGDLLELQKLVINLLLVLCYMSDLGLEGLDMAI